MHHIVYQNLSIHIMSISGYNYQEGITMESKGSLRVSVKNNEAEADRGRSRQKVLMLVTKVLWRVKDL